MLNDRTPRGWRFDGNKFIGNAREPNTFVQPYNCIDHPQFDGQVGR